MAEDLYSMLKENHANVQRLLKGVIETKGASKFSKIKRGLEIHFKSEEKYLFPKLDDRETVFKILEEHMIMKVLFREIENLNTLDEKWVPKYKFPGIFL